VEEATMEAEEQALREVETQARLLENRDTGEAAGEPRRNGEFDVEWAEGEEVEEKGEEEMEEEEFKDTEDTLEEAITMLGEEPGFVTHRRVNSQGEAVRKQLSGIKEIRLYTQGHRDRLLDPPITMEAHTQELNNRKESAIILERGIRADDSWQTPRLNSKGRKYGYGEIPPAVAPTRYADYFYSESDQQADAEVSKARAAKEEAKKQKEMREAAKAEEELRAEAEAAEWRLAEAEAEAEAEAAKVDEELRAEAEAEEWRRITIAEAEAAKDPRVFTDIDRCRTSLIESLQKADKLLWQLRYPGFVPTHTADKQTLTEKWVRKARCDLKDLHKLYTVYTRQKGTKRETDQALSLIDARFPNMRSDHLRKWKKEIAKMEKELKASRS
jgi:hypothetical protein